MSKLITTGTVATNKKARFNYSILETFEAGIILTGGEVKSMRMGHATIHESYADANSGEVFLVNAHITEYSPTKGGFVKEVASRPRKLLLHKKQVNKIIAAIKQKGKTLIPLDLYFNERGVAKVKIGLAVGKNLVDKREDIKQRDWNREKQRVLVNYNKK